MIWLLKVLLFFPFGGDLEIPLRAADRWLAGDSPYLTDSFAVDWGVGLPFLYPPYLLPFVAPFTALPRTLVLVGWVILCAAASWLALRRLGVNPLLRPFVMCWPPFAEAIWLGNVQALSLYALLVAVAPGDRPSSGRPRMFIRAASAAAMAMAKPPQIHALLWVARRDPMAALRAVVLAGSMIAAALLVTGTGIYGEWLGQVSRAVDPSWPLAGASLATFIGREAGLIVGASSMLAVLAAGPRLGPASLGLFVLVAAPNLHGHYWILALPAILRAPRLVGASSAALIATLHPTLCWIGFGLVAAALMFPAIRAALSDQRVASAAPTREAPTAS